MTAAAAVAVLVPFAKPIRYGRLVRRRKRFFVDVVLEETAEEVAAHTANTGAMTGLVVEGARVIVTDHVDNAARSLRYELEAIELPDDGGFISVNTISANAFAAEVVARGLVDELSGYPTIEREKAPSPRSKSRLDLVLKRGPDHARASSSCFVEVKSVTLKDGERRHALFPDAVTERGRKHLDALARLAKKGERAAMLYVNKRPGCTTFRPAASIDRAYATALRRAARAGVEVFCIDCVVDERGLCYGGRLAVDLS